MYGEEGEVLTEIVKNRTSTSVDWAEANSLSYNYEYTNDSKKMLTGMSVADLTENYTYDSLQRDKSIVQTLGENTYKKEYGYYKVGDHTTGLINVEKTYQNGMTKDKITYTYDCMGNITKIVKNGIVLKEYKYDSLGRIIYENNIDTSREISYTYDNQGNILSKTENGVETKYVYDENGFKLLSFGTQGYTYDNLGNPLNINSLYYSASWTKAHLLTTLIASGHSVNFTYDGKGLLVGKSIGGGNANYTFVYDGDKLIRQTYNNTTHMEFLYGKEGLIGFKYNGATYLYQKNIFGDIVKIVDSAGQVVAEYSYTAFGECTIITNVNNIANENPFRYRGYFLESNSGLYYLKSRFYNPVTGRFISPDDTKYLQPDTINGLNLYAYCLNNPVMNIDDNGCYPISTSQVMGYLVSSMEFVGKGFLGVLKHWTKNDVRPNNIGVGLFNKQQLAKLNSLNRAGKLFNKGVAIAQYVVLAVGVFEGVKSDKANGLSNGRIAANAIVNSAIAVGSYVLAGAVGAKVGAIVGSFIPVPIVGSIVGTVIGSLIGVGIDYVLNSSIGNKVVTEIKDFVYDVGETIADFGQTIGRGLEKVWDWIF